MHTDKPLFTPGPLTTSFTVKQAMLHDLGSRDTEFIGVVREIRQELLKLAAADGRGYEAILMQGSGTFGIEAVIGSITPPDGKWLFVVNGAYGQRMMQIARALKIDALAVTFPESRPFDKVSDTACFRIGTIGRIFTDDVLALLAAIRDTMAEMEVTL